MTTDNQHCTHNEGNRSGEPLERPVREQRSYDHWLQEEVDRTIARWREKHPERER